MEGGGAYGAGKATGKFDYLVYIKKPQVILRAVSWLFAIIVFGCIRSQGYYEGTTCLYGDRNACNFGVAIGVLAFLGLMGFLILDALFDNISSVQRRKYVVIADMAFSGFWTFMWFVCFCYLTNKWNTSVETKKIDKVGRSGVEAAIAFSFFSIPTFAGLTILAVIKAWKGVGDVFLFNRYSNDTNVVPSSTPISVPGVTEDNFLPMPFSGNVQNGNKGLPQGDDAVLRVDSGVPRGDSGMSHGDSNPPQGDSVFTPPQY